MANEKQGMQEMKRVSPVQVEKFLKGMDFPATKEDIINKARQQGADDNVLETLRMLPDKQYNSPTDISRAMGEQEKNE